MKKETMEMKVQKTMSNLEIYNIALGFNNLDGENIILPVKINFYLVKNKNKFTELGQQIDQMRLNICEKFGTFNSEKQNYEFTQEEAENANKEFSELMLLEQEVDYYEVSLEDFGDAAITSAQLEALTFMIKEE